MGKGINKKTVIYNARLANEGKVEAGYLVIEGEYISEVGYGNVPEALLGDDNCTVDADGRLLMPGIIDEHVHFRDPGLTQKADMMTESRAAVAGGVTSFIDMPNTMPATTTIEAVEGKMARAAEVSCANYGFFLGATNSNVDELLAADYSKVAGVKVFLGSSTGNMLVDSKSTISRIFAEVPALIAVHAEDESIISANKKMVVEKFGEDAPVELHPLIRSREACVEATKRAVEGAKKYNARLHVLHISTEDELALFSPGPVGDKKITAETCPQYLLFSNAQYATHGSRIKCNPAIKMQEDRSALRKAVADSVIDVIATDHAPHLPEEKTGGALKAVSGMPMIQFSLPVMLSLASEGVIPIEKVVETMCHNPARIYGIDRRGFLRPGYYADIVLVDDQCEEYIVTSEMVLSKCGWTPLEGATLSAKVDMTWVNGEIVWRYGVLFGSKRGKALKFSR
ncbi:MAG: dihydroorotase [Paramuribaculum sp.]|nr:dihydroorotase [Paramuribaculum sp.]